MLAGGAPGCRGADRRRARRAWRAMTGRRLWFVGIGGAGLSAYAQLARARGAEVGGWDRVRTPYLDALADVRGRDRARARRAGRLGGGRLVGVPGRSRDCGAEEFLRELVAARPSIVVAGTHGKGTTAGDDRLRPARDRARPGVADRGARAAARLERRLRRRVPRRRGRRVRPHRLRAARRRSPSSRTSSSTTTPSTRSLGELEEAFDALARGLRARSSATHRPTTASSALPGELNRLNAGSALAALEAAGVDARPRPRRRSRASPAPAGASRCTSWRHRRSSTTTRHHPTEIERTLAAVRERYPGRTVRVLFQPHLYSRTRHLAGRAGRGARRRRRRDGHRRLSRARAADRRRHRQARRRSRSATAACSPAWTPTVEQGVARLRAARAAGRRAARRRRRRHRPRRRHARGSRWRVEENVAARALHDDRHGRPRAVVRAAGDARRAAGVAALGEGARAYAVETIGLGSNVLVHDDGVDALVLKLGGRARRRRTSKGTCSSRAAGRPTRSRCIAPAPPGSAGFEFASAIPGTAGGGVRMNAGAYGREWRDVLIDARRRRRRRAAHGARSIELDLSYRHSALRAGRGRGARCGSGSSRASPDAVKARAAELLAQRKATQPTNKRTFGSVFKNPDGERGAGQDDRGMRAQGPPHRRRARSRRATRTSSRTRTAPAPPTAST